MVHHLLHETLGCLHSLLELGTSPPEQSSQPAVWSPSVLGCCAEEPPVNERCDLAKALERVEAVRMHLPHLAERTAVGVKGVRRMCACVDSVATFVKRVCAHDGVPAASRWRAN